MSKYITAIIATAATLALASPSFAGESKEMKAQTIEKNGQTQYCVSERILGSAIPIRTCLTKKEWEARGAKVAFTGQDKKLAANAQTASRN